MPSPLMYPDRKFSYADYLTWPGEERWELIHGEPCAMTPAPSRRHQRVVTELGGQFWSSLQGKQCQSYNAPFDVRLALPGTSAEETECVVQPDLTIICDSSKLDDAGCLGAPDLVVEVLSPATAGKDLKQKFALYEQYGVREYWIIHPEERTLLVYTLTPEGKYGSPARYAEQDVVSVFILPEVEIDLSRVFSEG